ncbi:MAG: glycosyltransferase family 2 protein [Bacteroidota bacterium]
MPTPRIAVLIPCLDEAQTIEKVVNDFQVQLPEALIYVFDNASTDATVEVAQAAGAIVRLIPDKGKGRVVRQMFREVDADIYILVDGDDTYPAEAIKEMLEPVKNGQADMVVGDRLSGTYDKQNKRRFHSFGNRLVRWLINRLYSAQLQDILSGYRVFNRLFVKNFPVQSSGFEIETEMSLHALDKRFKIVSIPISYKNRPTGSESKLKTYSDGVRVLRTIISIFKNYRPMPFFGTLAFALFLLGLFSGIWPIIDYLEHQFVYRVPLAILATGLILSGLISLAIGIILNTVSHFHRIHYDHQINLYLESRQGKKAPRN